MDNSENNLDDKFVSDVEKDASKKIKSKDEKKDIMFGLGFFGIVGWSIAIPTLLAIYLGTYLDKKFPSNFSWTVTLLFLGVIVGSFNTWRWLDENRKDNNK